MITDNDKPLRWDADMAKLFEWYHTCPSPWKPQWYESEAGNVTLHIIRSRPKQDVDEELNDSQKLDLARGRQVKNA